VFKRYIVLLDRLRRNAVILIAVVGTFVTLNVAIVVAGIVVAVVAGMNPLVTILLALISSGTVSGVATYSIKKWINAQDTQLREPANPHQEDPHQDDPQQPSPVAD
jgi:hypothetical protein